MVFNSFQFLWLFPLVFGVYYFLPCFFPKAWKRDSKVANRLLLVISYGLYMQWNPAYALILLGVTAVTYLFALKINGKDKKGTRKLLIFSGVILALMPLLVFKYYNFIIDSCSALFHLHNMPGLNWAVPLGISFFSFQAVGYLMDVYYRRISAERNWWDYMLFVAFFPQILAGPISKAASLIPQIKANRQFDYAKATQGMKYASSG